MFSIKEKFYNTICFIEYSNSYDKHQELFSKGCNVLNKRLEDENFSEFNEEESDLLMEIFSLIELENMREK